MRLIRLRRLLFRSLLGRRYWLLALLFAVAWTRWPGLEKPFFHDEWRALISFPHPLRSHEFLNPLAWVLHLASWAMVVTGELAWMRLPLLATGLLTVALGWRLGRLWKDWFAGLLVALCLAAWPFKAYYDTTVREYTVLLAIGVATIVAWEAYRARPAWWRLLIGFTLALLAAPVHEIGPLLLMAPLVYLGCEWASRALRLARLPRNREYRRAFAFSSARLLAAFLFLLGAVFLTQGPGLARMAWHRIAWEPTRAQIAFDHTVQTPAAPAMPLPPAPDLSPRLPRPGEAFAFWGDRLACAARNRSPATLLDVERWPRVIPQIWLGPHDDTTGREGSRWQRLMLPALAIGTLAMLFYSPPLALLCWALILTNIALVSFNRHLRPEPFERYFTLAALAALLLFAAGGALALRLARWPLMRVHRRRGALAALMLAAAGSLFVLASLRPTIHASATYYSHYWFDLDKEYFYHDGWDRYPHGFFMVGHPADNWRFLNRVRGYRHRHRGGDYWTAPARAYVIESDENYYNEFRLLEQLNPFEGIVAFGYDNERSRIPLLHESHTIEFAHQLGRGWRWSMADLDRRIYVTRGHAVFPLMPRLIANGEPASLARAVDYELDAYFELPGVYSLGVAVTPTTRLLGISVEGVPIAIGQRPIPGLHDASTTDPSRLRLDYVPLTGAPRPGDPINTAATHEWAGSFSTYGERLDKRPVRIRLTLSEPPGDDVPLVRLRLEDRFIPFASRLMAGSLKLFEEPDRCVIGLPLLLTEASTDSYHVRLKVFRELGGETLREGVLRGDYGYRTLAPGDALWVGSFAFDRAEMESLLEQTLVVYMQAWLLASDTGENSAPLRLFEPAAGRYGDGNAYMLCYLKFERQGDRIVPRTATYGKVSREYRNPPRILTLPVPDPPPAVP